MIDHTLLDTTDCNYVPLKETNKNKLKELEKIARNFKLSWFQLLYYLKGMDAFDHLPYKFTHLNSLKYFNSNVSDDCLRNSERNYYCL